MQLEDKLQEEFRYVDHEIEDEETLEKCVAMCKMFNVKPDELAVKWDSFAYKNKMTGTIVKLEEHLDQFETDLKGQYKKAKIKEERREERRLSGGVTHSSKSKQPAFNKENMGPQIDSFEADLGVDLNAVLGLRASLSPGSGKAGTKRKSVGEYHTPDPKTKARRQSFFTPSIEPSPESASFSSRTNEGEIVCSLNNDKVASAAAPADEDIVPNRVRVSEVNPWSSSEKTKFRYMFQDLEDKRTMIDNMTVAMTEKIAKANPGEEKIDEKMEEKTAVEDDDEDDSSASVALAPVGVPSQKTIVVGGRICCDEGEKLKPTAILLEGDRNTSAGHRMKLRMGLLKQYALFPGQIVCAKGMNTTGAGMVVEEFLQPPPLPHRSLPLSDVEEMNTNLNNQPLSIMVAAGPFTTNDTLDAQPLQDLLEKRVKTQRPDALVLMGPFLPAQHPLMESQKRKYSTLFLDILNDINERTKDLHTKILIVPSQSDIHAHPVFPQPPFPCTSTDKNSFDSPVDKHKFTFLSNPATFTINDITFGVCNRDVLFELGKNELQQGNIGDRIKRLAQHLLSQQSYYPLFPGEVGSNVDYGSADKLAMPVTPDVLILPSRMKYFAHEMDSTIAQGAVCVNPASLSKGSAGGTFAHITVHPRKDDELQADKEEAAPVESAEEPAAASVVSQHHIMSRMRVDITRI